MLEIFNIPPGATGEVDGVNMDRLPWFLFAGASYLFSQALAAVTNYRIISCTQIFTYNCDLILYNNLLI